MSSPDPSDPASSHDPADWSGFDRSCWASSLGFRWSPRVLLSPTHLRSDPQLADLARGFVLASVLGVYIAWSILRSGRP